MTVIRNKPEIKKIPPTTPAPTEQPQALTPVELTQVLTKVFGDLRVHGNEVPSLADALQRAGDLKPELLKNIERRLADPNLRATPETLVKLKALGLDVSVAAATQKRNTDLQTQEKVGQTEVKTVEAKVAGQDASTNALAAQQAVLDSHKATVVAKNELTPEFKLAKQLGTELVRNVYNDKASPQVKAVVDAVGPQVGALAQQTALAVMSDPSTMTNLTHLVSGKEGFQQALTSTIKQVGNHFLATAGVDAKNPAAIKATVAGIEAMAPNFGSLGSKLAGSAGQLGKHLLGEGAEAATKVAGAGAKAASTTATAAKAGGEALPVVGNVVAAACTLSAGANFFQQLTKKPFDFEKVMKEGVNTGTQMLGVVFPWAALGGTVLDKAWGARIGMKDQQKQAAGIPVTENANFAASLPLLNDSAAVLHSVLKGAGKDEAADKLGLLMATTQTMANLDLNNPGDRIALLRKDEQQAVVALAHESRVELAKAAAAETGSRKEGLMKLGAVFGALADTTLTTLRFDKREGTPGFDDKAKKELETKRNEQAATLLKQLGNLGLAELVRHSEPKTA